MCHTTAPAKITAHTHTIFSLKKLRGAVLRSATGGSRHMPSCQWTGATSSHMHQRGQATCSATQTPGGVHRGSSGIIKQACEPVEGRARAAQVHDRLSTVPICTHRITVVHQRHTAGAHESLHARELQLSAQFFTARMLLWLCPQPPSPCACHRRPQWQPPRLLRPSQGGQKSHSHHRHLQSWAAISGVKQRQQAEQ